MELTKELIQYLQQLRNKKLRLFEGKNGENNITVKNDTVFATQTEYKSQYGNYYYLNDNVIGGISQKSTLTCTSSTEAEIYAIVNQYPELK